jgi:hypothetical protein
MLVSEQEEVMGCANIRGAFFALRSLVPVKTKKAGQAPTSCAECERRAGTDNKLRVSEVLAQVIAKIEGRLTADDLRPSVADYLKLLQFSKELRDDAPKEITVRWVDPVKS